MYIFHEHLLLAKMSYFPTVRFGGSVPTKRISSLSLAITRSCRNAGAAGEVSGHAICRYDCCIECRLLSIY